MSDEAKAEFESSIEMLETAGFSRLASEFALKECANDLESALEFLTDEENAARVVEYESQYSLAALQKSKAAEKQSKNDGGNDAMDVSKDDHENDTLEKMDIDGEAEMNVEMEDASLRSSNGINSSLRRSLKEDEFSLQV